jgi:hypothetical protein
VSAPSGSEIPVAFRGCTCGRAINVREESRLENLRDLGIFGRANDRLLSCKNRLSVAGGIVGRLKVLVEQFLEICCFSAIGVGMRRQGNHHDDIRRRGCVLEQCFEKDGNSLSLATDVFTS